MIDFALAAERDEGDELPGCDLSGLSPALRPIMDDHHVRVVGGHADGSGWGAGSELRQTARNCDRGRSGGQSDVDAVHHAGDLPLSGPRSRPFCPPAAELSHIGLASWYPAEWRVAIDDLALDSAPSLSVFSPRHARLARNISGRLP